MTQLCTGEVEKNFGQARIKAERLQLLGLFWNDSLNSTPTHLSTLYDSLPSIARRTNKTSKTFVNHILGMGGFVKFFDFSATLLDETVGGNWPPSKRNHPRYTISLTES